MGSAIDALHRILKDETRRKIILLLREKESLSYVDLMKALGITNTGKMNYHLKVLGDLLSKKDDGQYVLSEKGVLASRLLVEFPKVTTRQMELSPKRPQVLWWGIIICGFALIGLFLLSQYLYRGFASGYASGMGISVPFIFLTIMFLIVGSHMIISDIRKNAKTSRKLSSLTKKAVIISTVLAVVVGMVLLAVAASRPDYIEHLDQIGRQENPGASYIVFLSGGYVYRFDIVVASTTNLDVQSVDITVTNIETNYTSTLYVKGTLKGQTFEEYFPVDTSGDYRIDWHELNVTQVTVYQRTGFSLDTTRVTTWTAGVFLFIAGLLSFVAFAVSELFQGWKTGVFWWGLVFFGLSLSWLFGLLWWGFVLQAGFSGIFLSFFGPSSGIVEIFVSLIPLSFGFYMMRKGAKKERQTYGLAIELKIPKLKFDLGQRNYRALVYLLASIIINVWLVAIDIFIYWGFLSYINIVGLLLIFLFFGRPYMYGGWFNPTSVLPFALLVFGLFVEIFVVCEFFISMEKLMKKLGNRTRKPESPNSTV